MTETFSETSRLERFFNRNSSKWMVVRFDSKTIIFLFSKNNISKTFRLDYVNKSLYRFKYLKLFAENVQGRNIQITEILKLCPGSILVVALKTGAPLY